MAPGNAHVRLSLLLPRRTARLALRALTPADLTDFQAYRHDPDVGRWQGWSPWPEAQAAAFLATMQALDALPTHDWRQIGIAAAEDGRLIGDVAFP